MGDPQVKAIMDQIKSLVIPILSSMGLELVDLEHKNGGGRSLLRIVIDKSGGVSLKDCEEASIYLGRALDVEDIIPNAYTLEVSSPGLDRPLKKQEDYDRVVGKKVRIKLMNAREGQWVIIGRLVGVIGDQVVLDRERGGREEIHFEEIRDARLEVEW